MENENILFISENNVSVGAEVRRRGRKNIITYGNDKRTQRRIQQRTYRQRKLQRNLGTKHEKEEYCRQIVEYQKKIVLQELHSITAFSLLSDLEEICSTLAIPLDGEIQHRLKDCKTSCFNDENGIVEMSFESGPGQAVKDLLLTETKSLASRSRNSVCDDQRTVVSKRLTKENDQADGYIPNHTAFYYLQCMALLNTLNETNYSGPNVLKMSFIETAFSDSHKYTSIQCLPSQSLRERLAMLPDTSVVDSIVNCIIQGSKCWGHDPLDTASWEMPEALFQDYWYICDEDLLKTTNQWRSLHHRSPIKWSSSGSNPSPSKADC
jgi:hypothetical protein